MDLLVVSLVVFAWVGFVFGEVVAVLPAFAAKKRFRWRLAFALFPFSRRVL